MRKESTSSQNAPTFTCVVCSKEKELVSVGLCDHRRVCSYCAMKSRLHYNYKKCPICLKILDIIFICEFTDKTPYKTLTTKKNEFYEDEEFDKCGIYYTTIEGKEEALELRGFNCPIKNCHSETFEDINSLQEHLNKVHKRFYCSYCLKENKLFLSQMNIYNKSNLNDHIKYGEYDKNTQISPPHPSCPFDGTTFYNDEQLFTHMNSFHFICQLCRDKKNIIFYPELKNLLAHYKDNHYCCPFQECLADVYVVFTKEEELISHLITKHKVQNANERLNKLIFDKKADENKELCHETGEFNFTEYVNNLKEESLNYKNNNKNRFINLNEQYLNDEGIEVVYRYENSNNNYKYNNNYYNYGGYNKKNRYNGNDNWGRGGKNNRRRNKNNYNNKFNNNNDWYNKNNYGNKYNNNRNNNYYQNSELKNIEEEDTNNTNNNINNINNTNTNNNNDDNNNNNNKNQNYNKNESRYNNKGKYYNKDKEGDDKYKNKKIKIYYYFLFSYYLNIIKEIIKNKITSEKIQEKIVSLPKETIYQIIVMIDKFKSYDKLLELTYLNNFGIDLEIHKKLREAISSATPENEENFKKTIQNLELKKLLIIYKYIYICSKKVDNLFYRLDLEQIDEDLYEDFCEREKKDDIVLDESERERRNRKAFLKAELNMGNKVLPEDKKVTEAFKKKEEKKEDKKDEEQVKKPKTKISMLLNNEIIENEEETHNNNNQNKKGKGKKKKGKGQFVEFNIHDYDLDKDFPKLK